MPRCPSPSARPCRARSKPRIVEAARITNEKFHTAKDWLLVTRRSDAHFQNNMLACRRRRARRRWPPISHDMLPVLGYESALCKRRRQARARSGSRYTKSLGSTRARRSDIDEFSISHRAAAAESATTPLEVALTTVHRERRAQSICTKGTTACPTLTPKR